MDGVVPFRCLPYCTLYVVIFLMINMILFEQCSNNGVFFDPGGGLSTIKYCVVLRMILWLFFMVLTCFSI